MRGACGVVEVSATLTYDVVLLAVIVTSRLPYFGFGTAFVRLGSYEQMVNTLFIKAVVFL